MSRFRGAVPLFPCGQRLIGFTFFGFISPPGRRPSLFEEERCVETGSQWRTAFARTPFLRLALEMSRGQQVAPADTAVPAPSPVEEESLRRSAIRPSPYSDDTGHRSSSSRRAGAGSAGGGSSTFITVSTKSRVIRMVKGEPPMPPQPTLQTSEPDHDEDLSSLLNLACPLKKANLPKRYILPEVTCQQFTK